MPLAGSCCRRKAIGCAQARESFSVYPSAGDVWSYRARSIPDDVEVERRSAIRRIGSADREVASIAGERNHVVYRIRGDRRCLSKRVQVAIERVHRPKNGDIRLTEAPVLILPEATASFSSGFELRGMGTDVEREISGPSIWQNKKGISGRCRIGTRHAGPKEENTLWRGVSRSELDGFAVRRLRVEHASRRWIVAH